MDFPIKYGVFSDFGLALMVKTSINGLVCWGKFTGLRPTNLMGK